MCKKTELGVALGLSFYASSLTPQNARDET